MFGAKNKNFDGPNFLTIEIMLVSVPYKIWSLEEKL